MGFLDSSSVTTWPAWATTATPVVAAFGINTISPHNGDRVASVSPTLTVAVDASPAPFEVEFQIATDTAFTAIVDDDTHTGVTSGVFASQTGTALANGSTYYWRARVGDGTSWSAWTTTVKVTIDLHTGNAYFYVYQNVGAALVTVGNTAEEVTFNVGCALTTEPSGHDYVYENVGFEVVLKSLAADYAYVDVDDSAPHIPHIWFLYLPYGFVGSEVQIWGQGFGTLQTDYHAHAYLDPGPNHTTPDLDMGIIDWFVEVATAAAYTPDRRIYAGTDGAPPYSDAEYEVITVVIPEAGMPSVSDGAQADPVYVLHDQGTSNKPTWLYYPNNPTSLTAAIGEVRTGGFVRVSADPLVSTALIEQRMAHLVSESYLIAGGRAERAPLLSALSMTSAVTGTAAATNGLLAPADVDLGATWRWLPAADHISGNNWTPMVGASQQLSGPDTASMPVLDTSYSTASRIGDRAGAAMLFTGAQYLTTSAAVTANETLGALTMPAGTVALVAVLHANGDGPRSTLLSTHQDTGGGVDIQISLDADQLFLRAGTARVAQHTITQVSGRPVIVVLAWDSYSADYFVLDAVLTSNKVAWPSGGLMASQKKLQVGRPITLTTGLDEFARMELLDLAAWNSRLPPAQIQAVVNQLDGIYGVSQ